MSKHFIHSHAICESKNIGDGTRIWAFAHVLPGARLGRECNVCDNVFIENDVIVGDRVTIKCGVQLWDGVTIEDDVFIGPNVTFTNDPFPRSKQYPERFSRTVIKKGASIGANVTILPCLTIGTNAMIGAGAVVTRSVPPNAIVVGNPARITGFVETKRNDIEVRSAKETVEGNDNHNSLAGNSIYCLKEISDTRGSLSVGEFEKEIPFAPLRYFLVYGVPPEKVRGEHAHIECHQFLIAVKGSVHVIADDGVNRTEFILDRPNKGLHLPPMTWGVQYRYSTDAVLLVFASHHYEPDDYITDYDEFIRLANAKKVTLEDSD